MTIDLTHVTYAGALRRALATLVDMVLFASVSGALAWPLLQTLPLPPGPPGLEEVWRAVSDPSWSNHAAGTLGIWIALWWGYFVTGWGLAGHTPGKALCGLVIVDHAGRVPIGATRAVMRLIAYSISSLTLGLGHLMILVEPRNRALHDILAGTLVVHRRSLQPHGDDPPETHRSSSEHADGTS